MSLQNNRSNKTFASILSDGFFHIPSEEGTVDESGQEAFLREYEVDNEGEKVKKSKSELKYDTLEGMIEGVYFRDSDFGTQVHIVIDGIDLSLGAGSNFGSDLMKKLPNIDYSQSVKMAGYSFKDAKSGKERRGISIVQGVDEENKGIKIQNFFYDPATEKELHDFPTPEGDTEKFDKDDWKIYFLSVKKFLVGYITENHLMVSEASKEEADAEKKANEEFDGTDTEPETEAAPEVAPTATEEKEA